MKIVGSITAVVAHLFPSNSGNCNNAGVRIRRRV